MAELVINGKKNNENANENGRNKDKNRNGAEKHMMKNQKTLSSINTETLGVPSGNDLYDERTVNHSVATKTELANNETENH